MAIRHSHSAVVDPVADRRRTVPGLGPRLAEGDKGYIQETTGVVFLPFIYLGAKHMVTGYDHLLFLFGVIFFLYRMKEIGIYVTMFAVGHSTTLLLGGCSRASPEAHRNENNPSWLPEAYMLAVLSNRTYRHLFLAQVIALSAPAWPRWRWASCRMTSPAETPVPSSVVLWR